VVCRDAAWHRCEILGWHRLDEPRRQDPHRHVEWLVKLRLGTEVGWFEVAEGFIRPA
jgi:hypothetical protein